MKKRNKVDKAIAKLLKKHLEHEKKMSQIRSIQTGQLMKVLQLIILLLILSIILF